MNISSGVSEVISHDQQVMKLVETFSKYFRTNFARIVSDHRAIQHTYLFLRPEPSITEKFGLNREVLCYIDESPRLDNRAFVSIEDILRLEQNRLLDDVFFFVSDATNASVLCEDYMEQKGRKVIFCSWQEIESAHEEFSLELIRQFLYSRDFFDVRDPVSADAQFFARYKLVDELFDSLKLGQNSGIFGLRKIGKTSVLERIQKKNDLSNTFRIALIDAQSPEIYRNNAAGVALEICRAFNQAWGKQYHRSFEESIPNSASLVEASRFLRTFVTKLAAQGKPLLLIIDELERILPNRSRITQSWNVEYLDLWRLLRAISQTLDNKFVFLVASTNPYFVEAAQFEGEDNPLYKFVRSTYLSMFDAQDLQNMLSKLGKPMGISFTSQAISMIHQEYGGHPFLSRQLCSAIARDLGERPLVIEERHVRKTINHFRSYSRDDMDAVLKVFSDFYPEEFSLLNTFIQDEKRALKGLETQPVSTKHLIGYGLLERTKNSFKFTMDALTPYLTTKNASEYVQADVPASSQLRHAEIQGQLNHIEPGLRSIVLAQYKAKHGTEWQNEIFSKLLNDEKVRIESRGDITAAAFMEELYLSDLIHLMLGSWTLFSRYFSSKTEFKIQSRALLDYARPMADHRKMSLCSDDAAWVKAKDACTWFSEKIVK